MSFNSSPLSAIKGILSADEIIEQSSASYPVETKVWSSQKNLHPALVVRPRTVPALQKILQYLCESNLEKVVQIDNNLGAGSFALLEIMQKVNFRCLVTRASAN
jgi:hypothetical protein